MILPDRLTDPNNCLVYYAFLIIKHLKKYKSLRSITLENYVSKIIHNYSQEMFIYSLNYLFALGKIEYNAERDELEALYEIK